MNDVVEHLTGASKCECECAAVGCRSRSRSGGRGGRCHAAMHLAFMLVSQTDRMSVHLPFCFPKRGGAS